MMNKIIFDHGNIILLKRSTKSIGKLFFQVPDTESFEEVKAHREISNFIKIFV